MAVIIAGRAETLALTERSLLRLRQPIAETLAQLTGAYEMAGEPTAVVEQPLNVSHAVLVLRIPLRPLSQP